MRRVPALAAAACAATLIAACAALPGRPLHYPPARQAEVVDDYFGTPVADPYRWLEDADSPETRAWVEAQNALSRPLLAQLPAREAIRQRLAALWSHERYSPPRTTPGGALVYTRHDGRTDQPLLMIQDAPNAAPRVLIDPNGWSADGADAMAHWTLSPDGRHVLYALQTGGSDWVEYRLLEIATGRVLPDRVRGVNFNFDAARIAWNGGSNGFFYSRFPEPPAAGGAPPLVTHARLYFHAVGTKQDRDTLVHERPDQPGWFVWGEPTDDGRYAVVYVERTEDSEKQVLVRDLRTGGALRPIVTNWDGKYYLVGNDGPVLFFRTSAGASRYRILACDLRRRGAAAWREVVPESADVLLDARLYGGELVASYLHDAAARLHRYAPDGLSLGAIPLPGPGTVKDLRGGAAPVIHFSFESFNRPSTVFRHDLASGEQAAFNPPVLAFRAEDYVTEQVFFASKDGTRVPMFVSRRRDAPKGPAPVLLYGYGGFANPLTPAFNVPHLVWMERGGTFAQVSLRGGTEYGEAWHEGGMLANKQNVFDDFIAAGEHLVRSGVTTPAQLAARGRSNGGLLVGAVVNQRPDLFGAAHAAVGVLDMLRYHRFGIAYAWAGDYGRSDDPKMFPVLRAYSPVHNTKPGTRYPAVLVTTAERDDRVHPLHSLKYTAALQAAQGGDRPVLIRVETRAGHGAGGAGTPLSKLIEENADMLAFLERYTR